MPVVHSAAAANRNRLIAVFPRTWRLLRDAIDVLLEATPKGLDMALARSHILERPLPLRLVRLVSGRPLSRTLVAVPVADHGPGFRNESDLGLTSRRTSVGRAGPVTKPTITAHDRYEQLRTPPRGEPRRAARRRARSPRAPPRHPSRRRGRALADGAVPAPSRSPAAPT
jgi:hypothetical protein